MNASLKFSTAKTQWGSGIIMMCFIFACKLIMPRANYDLHVPLGRCLGEVHVVKASSGQTHYSSGFVMGVRDWLR